MFSDDFTAALYWMKIKKSGTYVLENIQILCYPNIDLTSIVILRKKHEEKENIITIRN